MKKDAVIQGKGIKELHDIVESSVHLFDVDELDNFVFQLRVTNVADEKVNNLPQ